MRCSICDYCSEAPSEYYLGVHHSSRPNNRFKLDRRTNDYVCSVCYDEIGDDLRELEEENDEMDFNSPTVSMW